MEDEQARYSRHLSLPGFTEKSQALLAQARVLVVGCGGLGHPVLQYLAASGVGLLGIADSDSIQTTNLHRQILFRENDIGLSKLDIAYKALKQINSSIQYRLHQLKLNSQNAEQLLNEYDLVIDCSDNFPTRYLLDEACGDLKKPLIHGSVFRFEGRVALFHGNSGKTYRAVYPEPPESGTIPNCAEGGVLGSLAGLTGTIMATEAIKWITRIGDCLDGKMLIFDCLNMRFHQIELPTVAAMRNEQINIKNKSTQNELKNMIQEISAAEFKALRESGKKHTLIDVREPYEFEEKNLGGILVPLQEIPQRHSEIPKDHEVIIHCRSGVRSAHAIAFLQQEHGYDNLRNLQGGIIAYLKNQ